MKELESSEKEKSICIQRKLVPAKVENEYAEQQKKASISIWRQILNKILGYSLNDFFRIKEAGILKLEAEAKKSASEALKNEAEAAELFARADKIKQEAALEKIKAIKSISQNDVDKAELQAKAMERFEQAISKICQSGGNISFDGEQLKQKLKKFDKE